MTRNLPQRRRFRSLYLWHRYLGLVIAALVLTLAITGILVQHAGTMSLDQRYVASRALLRWYGLSPNPVTSYRTGHHWVSHAGETLYIDGNAVDGEVTGLSGAVENGPLIIAVAGGSVLMLTRAGELVERLSPGNGLPEPALGIGRGDGHIAVRGLTRYWQPDAEWLDWRPYEGTHPSWTAPEDTPPALMETITHHDLTHEISWERLLLDLHSGRLFGRWGPWVMDAAAIGMMLLAFSGIWVWLQRRPRRRSHHT